MARMFTNPFYVYKNVFISFHFSYGQDFEISFSKKKKDHVSSKKFH